MPKAAADWSESLTAVTCRNGAAEAVQVGERRYRTPGLTVRAAESNSFTWPYSVPSAVAASVQSRALVRFFSPV
jgi:hypothetical protein